MVSKSYIAIPATTAKQKIRIKISPTKMDRSSHHILRYFVILVLGFVITFPLLLSISIYRHTNHGIVCRTSDCLAKSMQLSKFMNKKVHPCDNFFQFACGNYINDEKLTPEQTFYQKAKTLMKTNGNITDPQHYHLIRTFYQSCINQGLFYNQIADSPLKKMAQDIQDSDWNIDNTKNWLKLYEIVASYGVLPESILSCKYIPHFSSAQQYIRLVTKPIKILTITDPDKIILYYLSIYQYANPNNVSEEVQKLINFENELISMNIDIDTAFELNDNDNMLLNVSVTRIANMKQRFKLDLDWQKLIEIMLPDIFNTDNLMIAFENGYFDHLQEILDKTDALTISKYILTRHILFLSDHYFFAENLSIRKKEDKCFNITLKYFSYGFADMYEKHYIPKSLQNLIFNEIDTIKSIFVKLLTNTTWLSKDELIWFQNSIRDINITLANYPNYKTRKFDGYYTKAKLYPKKYINNIFNITKLAFKFNIDHEYSKPINPNYAAMYMFNVNEIDISLSTIHHYYITDSMPFFVNYNQFGSIIGQRIGLSIFRFINELLKLDANSRSVDNFFVNLKCYLNDKIEYYGEKLKNDEVKREKMKNLIYHDLANFMGVKAAYLAYEEFLKNNTDLINIPKMRGLTKKQLYWVLFAQMVCRKPIIDEDISSIPYQINGPLKNFKEFAEDFNCPINSNMNPVDKCNAMM